MPTRIATFDRTARFDRTGSPTWEREHFADIARFVAPLGRALFAAIFLAAVPGHMTQAYVTYAAQQGVPMPEILVPLAGVIAGLGGLSILLGYRAKIGALLIVLFLVPVTLMMHNFWVLDDPMQRQMQLGNFMKNISMLGGALLITRCGSGPYSLDEHSA